MASSARLAIGLPVYNGERFLEEALRSILDQSFGDFELVVSDNASTDRTEAIVREVASRDPRMRYHRNAENIGLTRNFNQVFSMARGELFKWAAGDDALLPGFLERCVRQLDARPDVVLACTRARFLDDEGTAQQIADRGWSLMSPDPRERLRYVIDANHWVNSILGVIRTSALAQTGLLPEYPGGDYRLLAELSLQGKFYEDPEPLYLRRIHPRSSSQLAKDERQLAEYISGQNGSVKLPTWSRTLDNFRVVWRSGLAPGEKIALCGSIAGTMRAQRSRLWREMIQGVTAFPRRTA